MENAELLKNARNLLLKLHKSMVDIEREMYEGVHGPQTATEFLNLLLEDPDLSYLRKFSMLIVEIDEMFAAKDGLPADMIDANLVTVRELVAMTESDEYFKAKYQFALQRDANAAALHSELKVLVEDGNV
ncbi:MAG: hypothetical protein IPO41_17770 [Acidobacteria bacterium]|jgi:hypothetical protein|nr:hypothetical protein [Acidobacteriota bacterium]MBK9530109.1 hypothetical protein [Acidobacteriota bacterium]MBP7475693.1 hypothetical protein [Pyrinomonadaceae bacterium]MBP9110129.1 hypothetical protein [Pyrinomonadaceae bacterium]